ncbi:MAG: cobalt-zinc-cadmium resistance protein CzcA [Candidatus Azotimanducaceae bacterium]|jgi:cobalt-zinc-cadmium resistance protein CzcA
MLDSIIEKSISRRGIVMLMIFGISSLGIWSFNRLAIDAVPDITNVQVQINTVAQGYTPLEVEQRITFLVENTMAGLPQLDYTRSVSRYGLSQVTVVFDDDMDIYLARQLVSERLSSIRSQLPVGNEPELGPIATGLGEIFMFTVEAQPSALLPDGSPITPMELRSIHDWVIRPQMMRVPGVVEVNPIGGFVKEVLIAPDLGKLLQYDLSFSDLALAVQQNNQDRGAGFIERNGAQWLLRLRGQAHELEDLRSIVVRSIEGRPVRVGDVATVELGHELRGGAATKNGQEVVMSTVFMLIGENSRDVASRVSEKLKEIQASLPEGITATEVYNRTDLVNKTLGTVTTNLLEGALLVIVVLFLFLGNIRAAVITALVIPIAMLMTITGMVQAKVSANLMSLGALDFGLIVDGAVIIVENCLRRLGEQSPSQRLSLQQRLAIVSDATREVMKPALFGVFIITVVYLPIFSLTGIEGKMFHPMAFTVVIALLSAMFLSITFVPAAVAFFFNDSTIIKENALVKTTRRLYEPMLKIALGMPRSILLIAVVSAGLGGLAATRLGAEFIPNLDEGDIAMHALRIPGTSLSQAVSLQGELEKAIQQVPEVERVFAKIGTAEVATDAVPPSVADNFIILKPRDQWPNPDKPKIQVVSELESAVNRIPGNRYEFLQPIQMRFNELIAGVRAEVAISIFGDDFETLVSIGDDIESVVGGVPGVADLVVEQVTGLPLMEMIPDREALLRFGLSLHDVQEMVAAAIGGKVVGTLYEGDQRSDIVLRLAEPLRENSDAWGDLPVAIPSGGYVPLRELVQFELSEGFNQINRQNGKRRIMVTANVRGRDLGSFVAEVRARVSDEVEMPAGYWVEYGGTYEHLQSATFRLLVIVPITALLMLTLLRLALGTLRDSFIIFTGVPLALTGGVFALVLRDIPFSISAAVGFIALSGIAVLNGLVMLSFIKELVQKGLSLDDALIEGASTRLRPVLMTALVASLGFVPMAFNTGIGSEVQRPLATVVIGGIISSTLLTLFVLPTLYRMVHRHDK